MTAQDTRHRNLAEEEDDLPASARRIPSPPTLLHVLWMRKWAVVLVWFCLALPTGLLLSIFDLPQTYSASTVLRFPNVVGATTNVMRDIAITQRESILGILRSFQVMDATIRKLSLRMRITTQDVFRKDVFRAVRYGETLGPGRYRLKLERPDRRVTITYRPKGGDTEYPLHIGQAGVDGKVLARDLEIELQPALLRGEGPLEIEMEFLSVEESVRELEKSMGARALGTSNYQITMRDRDPYLVADILNTLREQFLQVYYGTTEVQDVGILVQMEKDLELSKQKLDKSQEELSAYYAAHPELSRQPQDDARGNQLEFLEARSEQDRVSRLKTRLDGVSQARPQPGSPDELFYWAGELLSVMSEAGEARANILRASLQDLQAKGASFRATLGPEHPKIAENEAAKEAVYRQIDEARAALSGRLEKDLSSLRSRVAASAPGRASQVSVKVELELERLTAVNRNNQQIYDRLQESYNRAKLVTGSEFFKVTVVDPARAAIYKPPSLQTRLLIAAGAVGAETAAVPALFLLWSVAMLRVWTKDDVRRLLRVKPLGVVAQAPAPEAPKKGADPAPSDPDARPPDPLLLFYGRNHRVEDLEAYRIIREETESYFRGEDPAKCCLMVTSTQPNEGKTLVTCNLALTFARKGKRTLLVDADFRLGRVDKVFNMPGGTGIDELLAQPDMTDDQFLEHATHCFQPTMQRNLIVAPRKRSNPNAGELVSSERFKAFVRMAREQFDVVLIDTPPIMITPEPLSLAEVVDGVIFICRSGVTSVSEAKEALQVLRERGCPMAAVLNGVSPSPFEQSRYKKYSYYYTAQPRPAEAGPQAGAAA